MENMGQGHRQMTLDTRTRQSKGLWEKVKHYQRLKQVYEENQVEAHIIMQVMFMLLRENNDSEKGRRRPLCSSNISDLAANTVARLRRFEDSQRALTVCKGIMALERNEALTINDALCDIQQVHVIVSDKSVLQYHPYHIDETSFEIC